MPALVVLDGSRLSAAQVAAVARDDAPVAVAAAAVERVRAAHQVAGEVARRRPVYGRTTGVGANRTIAVAVDSAADQHGLRMLRSHTVGAGPLLDRAAARAMLVVRLNQLAAAGSGVDPELLGALAEALNRGLVPPVRRYGAIGTGDLPALAATALCILGERPWSGGSMPPYPIDSLDALAFINSNAATVSEAALACHDLRRLLDAGLVVAALSFAALGGSPEPYAAAVHDPRPYRGQRAAATRLRALLAEADGAGGLAGHSGRVQDPFCLRALPQVHGAALDAFAELAPVITAEMNTAGENPLVDAGAGDVYHHGNFLTTSLTLALDKTRAALFHAAALSAARCAALMEPTLTGLRPFLADGPPASSGLMMLEYVAHSALADLRHHANPAALGGAVLSRGVEDHASFATQAAWRLTAALPAYETVLACELVTAVRALRLKGNTTDASTSLRAALAHAATALDPRTEDRPLDADLTTATELLPKLAGVANTRW